MGDDDDSDASVEQLLEQAAELPHSQARLQIVERAVRLADTQGDLEVQFSAREALISAATHCGSPERALVAFVWCLAVCDRDPESYPDSRVLWSYKWVAGTLAGFPQVSREQIEKTLQDLERRFRKDGSSMRAVYSLRRSNSLNLGEFDEYQRYHKLWLLEPRDHLSDCRACERNSEVAYFCNLDQHEKAMEYAAGILDGRLSCASVPEYTLATVLLPLLHLGRLDEAAVCHRRGYPLIAKNPEYLPEVGGHIAFLALTGNINRGFRLLARHLQWAFSTHDLLDAFRAFKDFLLLCDRAQAPGRRQTRRLRLPRKLPIWNKSGEYSVAELRQFMQTRCHELAAAFDRRNGNSYMTDSIAAVLAQAEHEVDYPIAGDGPQLSS